ncbi:hypothetical protein KKG48_03370, partial [Patescibacteria group bacterium]|nr:hypothetical protein [Patescibacteria group bacterium]
VFDKLYAPKKNVLSSTSHNLGFDRLALHAYSLEFNLPSGERLKLEARLPIDFKKALELLPNFS